MLLKMDVIAETRNWKVQVNRRYQKQGTNLLLQNEINQVNIFIDAAHDEEINIEKWRKLQLVKKKNCQGWFITNVFCLQKTFIFWIE